MEEFIRERERGIQAPLWSIFKIDDIFNIPKVKKYSSKPDDNGSIPFVTSTSINNGIEDYVNCKTSFNKPSLTISTNGKCFDIFLQNFKHGFAISSDVEILYSNEMNIFHYLFISTVMKLEQYRYSYGRKAKNGKVNNTKIFLPIDDFGNPNWEYMEQYIKSLPYSKYL